MRGSQSDLFGQKFRKKEKEYPVFSTSSRRVIDVVDNPDNMTANMRLWGYDVELSPMRADRTSTSSLSSSFDF